MRAALTTALVVFAHTACAQSAISPVTKAVSHATAFPERLGAKFNLNATSAIVATVGGSTFSWANQAGAAVLGGETSPIVLSQTPHANQTNQAALVTAMATGSACYSMQMQNVANNSLYNSGMFLLNQSSGKSVIFQDIYANDSQSNIYVQTQTNFYGGNQHALSTGSYANYTAGTWFFERVCINTTAQTATFEISPTGESNTFQVLANASLASIGSPDHVGFYVDANPTGGENYNGTITVHQWQATPGYNPQSAAPGGDHYADFQTVPVPGNGFPVSNNVPSVPGVAPKFGLTLASGATNVVDLAFPGSGDSTITIPDSATFRKFIYLNFDEGNLNSLVGFPQDSGQGPTAAFWGRARSYPPGDVTDLIPVTRDGLKVEAHCAGHFHVNCAPDQIRSGFFRLPTQFRPGMTMELTYKPATGPNTWTPWWLYTGEQLTPYPNSNPYASGLSINSQGPNFEIDMNDNYARKDLGGCPIGGQVDFGTPNIYGTQWNVSPHMVYAANSNGWSSRYWDAPSDSTSDDYECETGFKPGTVRTMTFNWRNDGSNLMDLFINGKRIYSAYMEYPQSQNFNGHQLGMTMLIGGQNVPVFNNATNVVDNDGIPKTATQDAGWTETIYSIKAWKGNLANPNCCDAGTNAIN